MVQVQSSWFSLVDRNPQVFIEIQLPSRRILKRRRSAFYRSGEMASSITVLMQNNP